MAKGRKGSVRARPAPTQVQVQSPQEAFVKEAVRIDLARQGLERSLQLAVDVGRAQGCTWADIGAALNVSRQAAFQRFGRRQGGEA
jgi:hypothetical protein